MVFSSIDPSAESHCSISVESVLRFRPMSRKEAAEDTIVLEQIHGVMRSAPATVVLNPIHGGALSSPGATGIRVRSDSDATANNTPTEYHFNHVLPDATSQDKLYYTLGLPIATATMSSLKSQTRRGNNGPKCHVVVCMGVAGSGKTYTCFGGTSISKRRASQDGLVPRLVDSLFSQSKHHASSGTGSKGFAVNISIAQVTHTKGSDPSGCVIHDLLSSGDADKPKEKKKLTPKRNLTVRGMAAKFERAIGSPILSPLKQPSTEFTQLDSDNIELFVEGCTDVTQAREVLQKGLTNSAKAAKGQNHHLLITLQPISNGDQCGDKIAILDMAGLEKGRKSQSRGKDSVANKNQEASAAVLHCLRTMIHNTDVRSGNSGAIDIVDDAISEISAVSQEKNSLHRQLKPVPFRQHKVTMLLQPLFTESASARVTLMLAAYPGHVDYYEKRILLQDMELLCGTALANTRGIVPVDLNRAESRSIVSADSRSTLTRTTTMDEDDASLDQGFVRDSRDRTNRNRNTSPQSLALSASIDEADENVEQPPAYAPSFTKARAGSYSNPSPTAPTLDAPLPMAPHAQPPKKNSTIRNPDYVSDFPGVHLPAKKQLCNPVVERQRVTSAFTSSNVGGRTALAPPAVDSERAQEQDLTKRRPVLDTNISHPRQVVDDYKTTRQPLGRSSLENGENYENENSLEAKTLYTTKVDPGINRVNPVAFEAVSVPKPIAFDSGIDKHSHRAANGGNQRPAGVLAEQRAPRDADRVHHERGAAYGSEARQAIPSSTRPATTNRGREADQGISKEAAKRVQDLERRMKELQRAKEAYEKKCSDLERENEKLKLSVKEAVVQAQCKWTRQDEEQFLRCREARLEDQTLVKKTLRNHMDRVNYIYDIKNQWAKTDKPHFDLKLPSPSKFQRAPDLDVRDQEWEAREAELLLGQKENYAQSSVETKKKPPSPQAKLKYRKKSMKAKQPSPLDALKKLSVKV